jgi:hypothetical protein
MGRKSKAIFTLTEQTHPNDPAIRAAIRKKLTNVKLTFYPTDHLHAGWVLECDQLPWKHMKIKREDLPRKIKALL